MKRIVEFMQVVINKLNLILCGECPQKTKGSFGWKVGQPEPKVKKGSMLELSITNEQKVKVTLTPRTATGKPAPVDGVPVWTVQSGV